MFCNVLNKKYVTQPEKNPNTFERLL